MLAHRSPAKPRDHGRQLILDNISSQVCIGLHMIDCTAFLFRLMRVCLGRGMNTCCYEWRHVFAFLSLSCSLFLPRACVHDTACVRAYISRRADTTWRCLHKTRMTWTKLGCASCIVAVVAPDCTHKSLDAYRASWHACSRLHDMLFFHVAAISDKGRTGLTLALSVTHVQKC